MYVPTITLILLLALPENDCINFLASVLFIPYNFSTKVHLTKPLKSNENFGCPNSKIVFARETIFESIFFVAEEILPNNCEYNLACLETQCNSGLLFEPGGAWTQTKN